jgi:signal transduction histidine kinase
MEDLTEDVQRCADLQAIIDECHRCRWITGGLLGFARIQSDSRESVDLVSLIAATVESLQPQKLFREVSFKQEKTPPESRVIVTADSDRLRQVLVNLFLNAAQAMHGVGEIILSLDVHPESVSLLVADSGPGVKTEFLERIFEPFFSTKASGEGTGLGLSLCRKLIEDHNGQLSLEPTSVGGAHFKLTLPMTKEESL